VSRARELALTLGGYNDLEYRLRQANGQFVWVREHAIVSSGGYVYGITSKVDDRKRTEEKLGFLVKASAVLSSSLTPDKLARRLARLIAGSMADLCVIELLEDESNPPLIESFASAKWRRLATRLKRDGASLADRPRLLRRLGRDKAILMSSSISAAELSLLGAGENQTAAIKRAKPTAAMVLPLLSASKVIGAVTLICFQQTSYSAGDVQLAEDLCRRAGSAFHNARLYGQSERAKEELTKANEAKDEFLAIMAHELRTPLTTIFGMSRLLERRPQLLISEQGQQHMTDIATSAAQLVRLTDDLMLLARVHLGEETSLEPVSIRHLLGDVTAEFIRENPDRKVSLQIAPDVLPVLGSPTFVRQTLLNLIGNAHKYSPPGAPITIDAHRRASDIAVTVADSGRGLPESEIERIFGRFYRSDNADGVRGSGIGLVVCRTLVEAQGGRIWAGPAPEGGLEVSFALPLCDTGEVEIA
jgi:signal transduction histidine kinase